MLDLVSFLKLFYFCYFIWHILVCLKQLILYSLSFDAKMFGLTLYATTQYFENMNFRISSIFCNKICVLINVINCQLIIQLMKMWNWSHKLKICYHATLIYFHEFNFSCNQFYKWWYLKFLLFFFEREQINWEDNKSVNSNNF